MTLRFPSATDPKTPRHARLMKRVRRADVFLGIGGETQETYS